MEEKDDSSKQENKNWLDNSILNYQDKGKQSVFKFLGVELTAPAGLKNPGFVYISFIVVNIFIFFVLKSFVVN